MSNDKFLKEITGNYFDSIKNIIFKLQKYTDTLLVSLNDNANPKQNFHFNDKIMGFLICESDEIMRNKMLRIALDIRNILVQKYDNLIVKIHKNDGLTYCIPVSLYTYFNDKYQNMDYEKISQSNYTAKKDDSSYSVFNFKNIFDKYENKYYSKVNDASNMEVTGDELIEIIDECYHTFLLSLNKLISLIENCTSSYSSAVVMNDMIKCMVISYICVSNIQVIPNEKT